VTCKLLTKEEWAATDATFVWLKVENKKWHDIHREMVVKWIERHLGAGFIYWDGNETYIFEKKSDMVMFRMWVADDPFSEGIGDIEDVK